MERCKVALVGGEKLLLMGIDSLLRECSEIEVVILSALDPAVSAQVKEQTPDIILVPGADIGAGFSAVGQILRDNPQIPVIAVGLKQPEMRVYWSGSLRQASPGELLSVIHEVQGGAMHGRGKRRSRSRSSGSPDTQEVITARG
ncbi:MAG: hypothetical protein HY534_07015 [Chloroflexi bacterium]|nr:hypothetical protein [Chloroflexota bacterium]